MIIKRFNKKELERFTDIFEIKCNKIMLELVDNVYFITINNGRTFSVNYNLIKDFI